MEGLSNSGLYSGPSFEGYMEEGPQRKRRRANDAWPGGSEVVVVMEDAEDCSALCYQRARLLVDQVAHALLEPQSLLFPRLRAKLVLQRGKGETVKECTLRLRDALDRVFDLIDPDESMPLSAEG